MNLYWCFIDKLLEDLLHSTNEEDFYNLQKGAIALIAVTSHQVKMLGDFLCLFPGSHWLTFEFGMVDDEITCEGPF